MRRGYEQDMMMVDHDPRYMGGGSGGGGTVQTRPRQAKRRGTQSSSIPGQPQIGEQTIDQTRNRFMNSMAVDPLQLAAGAQGFLGQAAQGFAADLMPELSRGLAMARSRFSGGGGAIRSGGAQQAEEYAFERLFANPMQNKIAQLATTSLGYGQREAQRGVENQGALLGFDENRFMDRLNFGEGQRQFNQSLAWEKEAFKRQQSAQKKRGIGRLLGTVAGGVGGFLLGGPGGAMAGASIGQKAFG